MAYLARQPAKPRRAQHRRHGGPSPLAAPLLVFAGVATCAVLYVAYVLWPRWPDGPVSRLQSNFVNGVKSMPVRLAPIGAGDHSG